VCRDYIRVVAERAVVHEAALKAAGLTVAIVAPGQAKWIKKYKLDTKFPGPCYSDFGRQVFAAFSVPVADGYGGLLQGSSPYTGSTLSGAMYTAKIAVKEGGESGDMKQLGAVFVLDAQGSCSYHHLERNPQDHPVIEDVWRAAGAVIDLSDEEKTRIWKDPDAEDD